MPYRQGRPTANNRTTTAAVPLNGDAPLCLPRRKQCFPCQLYPCETYTENKFNIHQIYIHKYK